MCLFVKYSIFTRKVKATKFLMEGQTGVSFQIQVSVKVSELAHLKIKKNIDHRGYVHNTKKFSIKVFFG